MWDMMCFFSRGEERTGVRLVFARALSLVALRRRLCPGMNVHARVWFLGLRVGTRAMADSKQSLWWCTAAPVDTDALVTRLTHQMHARDAVAGQGPYEFDVAPAIDRFASLAPQASATTWSQLEVVSALTVRIPPSAVSGHSANATSRRRMALLKAGHSPTLHISGSTHRDRPRKKNTMTQTCAHAGPLLAVALEHRLDHLITAAVNGHSTSHQPGPRSTPPLHARCDDSQNDLEHFGSKPHDDSRKRSVCQTIKMRKLTSANRTNHRTPPQTSV